VKDLNSLDGVETDLFLH